MTITNVSAFHAPQESERLLCIWVPSGNPRMPLTCVWIEDKHYPTDSIPPSFSMEDSPRMQPCRLIHDGSRCG